MAVSRTTSLLAMLSLALFSMCRARSNARGHYLYVWNGCNTGGDCKDFLATIDMIPSSPKYGQVIKKTFIPYGGVEAHHCGLYNGGKMLAAGALLDFAVKSPSVFMFDLTKPASPKYVRSGKSIKGGAADDVAALPGGGFLLTMMGSNTGGTPGRVARFDSKGKLVAEYPRKDNFTSSGSFNPHGISISAKLGVFATADFFEPVSAAASVSGDVLFRETVRLWDLKTFSLLKTFVGQGAKGTMDIRFLGDRPYAVSGNGLGDLWLLDVKKRTYTQVFSVPDFLKPTFTCLMRVFNNGKRLVATVWQSHSLVLINFDDPYKPKLIHYFTLPETANPHGINIAETSEGLLVVVACYFVDRPGILKVSLPGDKTVRFFLIRNDKIIEHPKLKPINFGKDHASNPHDVALLPVS